MPGVRLCTHSETAGHAPTIPVRRTINRSVASSAVLTRRARRWLPIGVAVAPSPGRYQICALRTASLHPGNRLPKPLPYNE